MNDSLVRRVQEMVNPLNSLQDNLLSEWLKAAHLVVDLWQEVQLLRLRLGDIPASEVVQLHINPDNIRD